MTSSHEEKNLKVAVEELRRVYDWLCKSYGEQRTKTLAFIGASFTVLTFLYANGDTFIPSQTYGKIFYFAGLGLILLAIGYLFKAIQPKHWEFPTEHRDFEDQRFYKEFKSEKDYLEYVKNRYLYAYNLNVKVYEDKQKLLNNAFYVLVLGAIILIVLNLFKT